MKVKILKVRFEANSDYGHNYCNYCDHENWDSIYKYVPFNNSTFEEVDDDTYERLKKMVREFNFDRSNYPYYYVMFEDGFEPRVEEALADLIAYEEKAKAKKEKEAAEKKAKAAATAAAKKMKAEANKVEKLKKQLAAAEAAALLLRKELDSPKKKK